MTAQWTTTVARAIALATFATIVLALGAYDEAHAQGQAGPASEPLIKHEVSGGQSNAVCNDGSPPAFYFRPGSADDRDKWVLYFRGGGGCATEAECTRRWSNAQTLVSSSDLALRLPTSGLLSASESINPDFAHYNHVLVHYCSSDAYAGDGERMIDGRLWQFRGSRIVDAVLDQLSDRPISGASSLADATEVLVAGSSAGALGVHNNLDRIAARLESARVVGVADSGWIPIIERFGPGTLDVRPDAPETVDFINTIPDESCVAANPSNRGACMNQSFAFPFISTPMFIYADHFDAVHLRTLGVEDGAPTPEELAYVLRFAGQLRRSIQDVPAYFAPNVGGHTALINDRFNSVVIDGHTFAETLGNWYFGRPGDLQLIGQSRQ